MIGPLTKGCQGCPKIVLPCYIQRLLRIDMKTKVVQHVPRINISIWNWCRESANLSPPPHGLTRVKTTWEIFEYFKKLVFILKETEFRFGGYIICVNKMQILQLKQMRGKSFAIWAMDLATGSTQSPRPTAPKHTAHSWSRRTCLIGPSCDNKKK